MNPSKVTPESAPMPDSPDCSFEALNTHCNELIFARKNWDILWDDAARYIMPRKGNILTKRTSGQEQTIQIYDTTADKANKVFAAGLVSNIVPAGEKWFRFEAKNPQASEGVRQWLAATSDIITDLIYTSNFYRGIHEDFLDAGCFNTSAMLMEEGKKYAFNFVNIPVGFFAIDEDSEGNVDTFCREWEWTARQAAQKWGRDRLGKQCCDSLDAGSKQGGKKFKFRHLVKPRMDGVVDLGYAAPTARPWASYYLCLEDKCVVEEGGYYEFPYLTSRLLRSNGEVYGRGPGLDAMPEIKMVNAMERDILAAVQKMVNPPWLSPDDSSYTPDNRPNGVTYWDSTQQQNKPEQLEMKNRVDLGEQKTEQKREIIRDAFYNQMFQMLTTMEEQKREKTAYEVQQMVAEKLVLFSPLFARMCEEKLNPLLERAVGIAARKGLLPPPPSGAVEDGEYQIVYTSKIALAIKAAENQSFATMIQLVMQMAQLDSSVVDVVDWRGGFRKVARNIAFPPSLIRDDAEVDRRQADKQKALQEQQQAEHAQAMTQSAKNLGPGAQKLATEKLQAAAQTMS